MSRLRLEIYLEFTYIPSCRGRGKFYLTKLRLGASLIQKVIHETFAALWSICRNKTRDDRIEIAERFEDRWNVPNSTGDDGWRNSCIVYLLTSLV